VTRAANGNLPELAHKQIARLMQLHEQTHPERIGRRYNITGDYVRKIWSQMPTADQAELEDILGYLR
jgi:hypothetical protein